MVELLDFVHLSSRKEEDEFPFEGLVHDLGQHHRMDAWPDLNLSSVYRTFQVLQAMRATCVG